MARGQFVQKKVVPSNFVIAPFDAVNKERADLVLTGTDDITAINQALQDLDTARGGNTDISIRVDFLGGSINNVVSSINVPPNFKLYGNGIKIIASSEVGEGLNIINILENSENVLIDGFEIQGYYEFSTFNTKSTIAINVSSYGCLISNNILIDGDIGILSKNVCKCNIVYNKIYDMNNGIQFSGTDIFINDNIIENCINGVIDFHFDNSSKNIISRNKFNLIKWGIEVSSTESLIIDNIFYNNDEEGIRIFGSDCNISNNILVNSNGIYVGENTLNCIFICNNCSQIRVKAGTNFRPSTKEAMEDVNLGTVTVRA